MREDRKEAMTAQPKPARRTKPSLDLEAAALAYGKAEAAYRAEQARIKADHVARTGSIMGSLVTHEAEQRQQPFRDALNDAEHALHRAAKALWKARQKRKPSAP